MHQGHVFKNDSTFVRAVSKHFKTFSCSGECELCCSVFQLLYFNYEAQNQLRQRALKPMQHAYNALNYLKEHYAVFWGFILITLVWA